MTAAHRFVFLTLLLVACFMHSARAQTLPSPPSPAAATTIPYRPPLLAYGSADQYWIAAVEPYTPERLAEAGGHASAFHGIVSVDELDSALAKEALQFGERGGLGFEGHDPGMGGGTHDRDAEPVSGEDVAGAGTAADVSGARGENPGLGRMGAAGAKLDHFPALRGVGDAGGLTGNQGFEGNGREEICFGELGFDERRADVQDRLPFVEYGAFRDGKDVAGKLREVMK